MFEIKQTNRFFLKLELLQFYLKMSFFGKFANFLYKI